MSNSTKSYQFSIAGNAVTAVYEIERGRVKLERMDSDESWTFDGTNVIKTEFDKGRLETTVYSDIDGDGFFTKAGKSYAAPSSNKPGSIDQGSYVSTENYKFDINANQVVTAMFEVKNGRVKAERIDRNESVSVDSQGVFSSITGQNVVKTETKFGNVETRVFTDANGDGLFQESFDITVVTGANPKMLETFQFSLANGATATDANVGQGDLITGMMELGRRGWKVDRVDANETLQVVDVEGDAFILKTEMKRNGEIDFNIFQDRDSDGLWTEIADGETHGAFVTPDGQIDLVGIVNTGLLDNALVLAA